MNKVEYDEETFKRYLSFKTKTKFAKKQSKGIFKLTNAVTKKISSNWNDFSKECKIKFSAIKEERNQEIINEAKDKFDFLADYEKNVERFELSEESKDDILNAISEEKEITTKKVAKRINKGLGVFQMTKGVASVIKEKSILRREVKNAKKAEKAEIKKLESTKNRYQEVKNEEEELIQRLIAIKEEKYKLEEQIKEAVIPGVQQEVESTIKK